MKKNSLKEIIYKIYRLMINLIEATVQMFNFKILSLKIFALTPLKISKIFQTKNSKRIYLTKKNKIIFKMRNKFQKKKKIKKEKTNKKEKSKHQANVKNCTPAVHHSYVLTSKTNRNKVQPRKLRNKKELSKFEAPGNTYWSV